MPAKKGQTFNRYSDEIKKEAVRLRVEEGWTYTRIMEKFGIKRKARSLLGYVRAKTRERQERNIAFWSWGSGCRVLHRVPANVVGDGVHTIEQLVHEKNKDPLRGKGYKTPLEKIQLGKQKRCFEKSFYELERYTPTREVYLSRENRTLVRVETVSILRMKYQTAIRNLLFNQLKAAGATICGVDMMIDSLEKKQPIPITAS